MKKLLFLSLILAGTACVSENYSNGERIGLVTQFSQSGIIWKSWEGHLNLTQTGMNSSSSTPFDFSIDNDHEDSTVIKSIKYAADSGWKVKLTYHETFNKNWWNNRGETDHFITKVEVLDKSPVASAFSGPKMAGNAMISTGHVIDTIYVVIVPKPKS